MVGFGCDTIPILRYPHNTWIWVGLNWKFMYHSMGSLWTSAIGVMPKAASRWLRVIKLLKMPMQSQTGRWSLLGGPAYRGGACTRVCKWKVMVDDPHTEYDNSGLVTPDGWMQMLWHKSTTSAECKNIWIAASAVMDGWMAILFRCQMFSKMTGDLKGEVDLITTELWEWH